MREKLTESLCITQIVFLCIAMFAGLIHAENNKQQITALEDKIDSLKIESVAQATSQAAELADMAAQLKHNNIVTLKVLEGKW